MSPVHPNFDPDHLYFITTTAVERVHIFSRDCIKQVIVKSLQFIHTQHWINLYAFVIMPNHIHLMVRFFPGYQLPGVMRDFKKFTSKQIFHSFEEHSDQEVLGFLSRAAQSSPKQTFKVWEDDYDARNVFSSDFLWQKLEYIHHNPCRPQWKLAKKPEEYAWSSARYYITGQHSIILVDDVRDILTFLPES
jgi:putative transposase